MCAELTIRCRRSRPDLGLEALVYTRAESNRQDHVLVGVTRWKRDSDHFSRPLQRSAIQSSSQVSIEPEQLKSLEEYFDDARTRSRRKARRS